MFRHNHRLGGILLAAALVVGLGACDGTGTVSSSDGSSMSVQLTDAPAGDLENAWVEITRITLQGEGGGVDLLTQSTDLIELTRLADRTQELVSDVAVPSGTYTQLRVVVGAAAVETEDGDVFSKDGAAEDLGKRPRAS